MMNSERQSNTPILLLAMAIGLLIGLLTAPKLSRSYWTSTASEVTRQKIDQIFALLADSYVDEIDIDSVGDEMIRAMMTTLDPHSTYLTAKELKESQERIQGHFEGVGLVLHAHNDTICVRQVIEGGPASHLGFLPGDRIVTVDTTMVSGVGCSLEKAVDLIRGQHHSMVDLGIVRIGTEGVGHYKVRRDKISVPTVAYSGMIDSHTGYIRLSQFGETSHSEVHNALIALKKQGMTQLVFDLRDNGGGLLDVAIKIADEFLPNRRTIVYTEGAHIRRSTAKAHSGGLFETGKMVVMINEFSASASEIIAGALQDNDRATIVGRRSFGKGLVQEQIALPGDASVLLTIARYHTPSGRCIQRPYDKGNDEYYNDFLEDIVANATNDTATMRITDSTEYHTMEGRTVYGGGGIYPDHYLMLTKDTLLRTAYQVGNGEIYRYAFDYVSRHAEELMAKYPNENSYIASFEVDNAMMDEALKECKANTRAAITKYNHRLRTHLKGHIADHLYNTAAYYRIVLPLDNEVKESIKLLSR